MTNLIVVPKNILMLIAGMIWCVAGAMVSGIGLPLLWNLGFTQLILYPLAGLVFLIFYFLIFSRLVAKHTKRIRERPEQRLPFWNFFDASSYVVMVIMMAGGMWLRLAHILLNWMIAFFYSGLGIALFSCGVLFLGVFSRKDVLLVEEQQAGPTDQLD
ncbi:MAG TPA: hypothetical protein VK206_20850 [Anaerolineales bacterium]|nr:hypothetical protein [Anaerolineales bacterium]